ncbi:hypothetical protein PR003_g22399 [Phytophthora rubi]|uniref:Uncharacterized protein n=1 Tax=Phytophthora rubi TaxID=129364 RepID=A0A6A3IXZ3_9STRA|nr:hypothetical protein PR001_g22769 [Phytophthora rubi]KAE8987488.1 hypothetical protein PR002_g22035 [Phytophthora rubi]KAE9301961.1 hypothetical protein PR003_g22399 [Phytophthora rubi]
MNTAAVSAMPQLKSYQRKLLGSGMTGSPTTVTRNWSLKRRRTHEHDHKHHEEQRVPEHEDIVSDWAPEGRAQTHDETRRHLLEADDEPQRRAQVAVLQQPPMHQVDGARLERAVPGLCGQVAGSTNS